MNTKLRLASVTTVLLTAGALTYGSTPAPASTEGRTGPVVVTVRADADGLAVTGDTGLRSGPTTFVVSTSDTSPHWIGVISLNDGVPLDVYLRHLTDGLSDDPATGVAGETRALRDGRLHSGAAVHSGATLRVTVGLTAGRYYLVDYATLGRPEVAVHPITVTPGRWTAAPMGTVIAVHNTMAGHRFAMPDRLAARGTLTTVNLTDQMNESVLMRLQPWATEADVRRFFTVWGADGVYPFLDHHSLGLIPMSPYRHATLAYDFPPGRYAVMSWVRNLDTGNPNVTDGTFKIVELLP